MLLRSVDWEETTMATDLELFGGTIMSPVVDPYSVYRRLRREQPVMPGLIGRALARIKLAAVPGVSG